MDRLEKIAQFMLDQHKSQQNFQNLPQILMPENFEEAYEIQQIFQKNSGRGKLGAVSYTHLTLPTICSV